MAYYFPHDENARSDEKILRLLRVKGMKGYGIFWAVIEKLHERGGSILISNIPDLAYEFKEDETNVSSVIKEFGLFQIDMQMQCFSNARVSHNLNERNMGSERGRGAARKRWDMFRNRSGDEKKNNIDNQSLNASALHLHSDSNADAMPIKEYKIKEDNTYTYLDFISQFREITGKAVRGDAKSKRQFDARIREGANKAEFQTAITNCFGDQYHKENPKFLTCEFITRSDKFQKYLLANPPKKEVVEIKHSAIYGNI